ncbi:hypothetical protein DdX_09274 [Ditylenchus destructor]|uniref:Uncharacterized protein n=1 Tax=Ditylenchus destructor TaxID=166010 RepID=A0AAD4N548_9BILA|nr:hypothetical protein DdX_09274 [Ditylenchus destructor]
MSDNQLHIFESLPMDQQPTNLPSQQPVQQIPDEQINKLKTHITDELKVEMRTLMTESLGQLHQEVGQLHQEFTQMAEQLKNSFIAMENNLIQSLTHVAEQQKNEVVVKCEQMEKQYASLQSQLIQSLESQVSIVVENQIHKERDRMVADFFGNITNNDLINDIEIPPADHCEIDGYFAEQTHLTTLLDSSSLYKATFNAAIWCALERPKAATDVQPNQKLDD